MCQEKRNMQNVSFLESNYFKENRFFKKSFTSLFELYCKAFRSKSASYEGYLHTYAQKQINIIKSLIKTSPSCSLLALLHLKIGNEIKN